MIIRRFTLKEFEIVKESTSGFLLLESQPYGTPDEQLFVCALTEDTEEQFNHLGIILNDTGRTGGFFQNKGASGVLHPQLAPFAITPNAAKIVKGMPNATIHFEGETWAEILTNISEKVNIVTSTFIDAKRVKSKKSNKRRTNS